MNKNIINDLIKQLEYIRDNGKNISLQVEPRIEEICGTCDGTLYGKAVMDIRIEYNDDTYIKNTNDIFSSWQSYSDYMKNSK